MQDNQITLDSFYLGQDIDDVLAQANEVHRIITLPDDKEKRYDFASGLSVKTGVHNNRIVAIQGGKDLFVPPEIRLGIGDSLESVLQCLGEPVKKMEGLDLKWEDAPFTDAQMRAASTRILRLAYVKNSTAIRLDFHQCPVIDFISVRAFSADLVLL